MRWKIGYLSWINRCNRILILGCFRRNIDSEPCRQLFWRVTIDRLNDSPWHGYLSVTTGVIVSMYD